MRRLLSTFLTIVIAITLSACGESSTGPDSKPNDNDGSENPVTYSVSVDLTPSNAGTVSPSLDESYEEGQEIQLLAHPRDQYVFTGWTGDMEGNVNPLPLTVSQDFTLTANFELKTYELTTSIEGKGSIQENLLEQKSKEYEHGTVVELIATPATGYRFVEWQGDVEGTDNPTQITVDNPKEVTAIFKKKNYELAVTTQGSGAVSEQVVSKAKDYEYRDVVELTPSAAEGWEFSGWNGDLTGSDNPAQITIDTAKTVTAVFERKTFAMDITVQGEGSIAKDPDQAEYEYGDKIILKAQSADGWGFKEWAGEIAGTTSEISVTIQSERNITAVFEENSYDLTVHTDGEGLVREETGQAKSYNHGTSVQLTAEAADGWRFVEWEGNLTGSSNPEQLTVDTPKEITAVFEPLFHLAKNGVTVVCPEAEPGEKGILNGELYGKEYVAVDRSTLEQMIDNNKDVTTGVCTSPISDMSNLLKYKQHFDEDISKWDVSNVTQMDSLFYGAHNFNQDIGSWNVSSVTSMNYMFRSATSFNQDIGSWDVSNVTTMSGMLQYAISFNQYLNNWDVSSVTDMSSLFSNADNFNQDIGNWDVSSVTDMSFMFYDADRFNKNIYSWDVSNVTNMSVMFSRTQYFNQDIGNWDVSSVTDMSSMFSGADNFNRDINSWDVSSVTDMSYMFYNVGSFNRSLNSWDVSNVTDMGDMFNNANAFNQGIESWDVSSVTDMSSMFNGATSFNKDIGNWDVSNVTSMFRMFKDAVSFNQDIGGWDLSSVTSLSGIFWDAENFNQDISNWDVSNVEYMSTMFANATNFNQDISSWDISSASSLSSTFSGAASFNQDISNWDVSNVTNMQWMFNNATSFNQDIRSWCVTNIDSKPIDFDTNAGFDGDTSIQPQWGTCP